MSFTDIPFASSDVRYWAGETRGFPFSTT